MSKSARFQISCLDVPDSLQLALLDPDEGVDGAPLQVEDRAQQVQLSAHQPLHSVCQVSWHAPCTVVHGCSLFVTRKKSLILSP